VLSLAVAGGAAAGATALVSVAEAPAAAASTSSTPSASALVKTVTKAILAARSAHFVVTSKTPTSTERIIADAGPSTGEQRISAGKSTAEVRVTKRYAYFEGNSSGLSTFFGMPSADIKKTGTKWVFMKAGTSQYTSFKDGIVVSSLPTGFLPTTTQAKTTTVTTSSYAGAPTYLMSWTITSNGKKVAENLEIAATGRALPVFASDVSGNDHSTTTFSKWGEVVSVKVPTSLIALSALTG